MSESEISVINRLAAEREDNLMWKEYRVRLLRNMGLVSGLLGAVSELTRGATWCECGQNLVTLLQLAVLSCLSNLLCPFALLSALHPCNPHPPHTQPSLPLTCTSTLASSSHPSQHRAGPGWFTLWAAHPRHSTGSTCASCGTSSG